MHSGSERGGQGPGDSAPVAHAVAAQQVRPPLPHVGAWRASTAQHAVRVLVGAEAIRTSSVLEHTVRVSGVTTFRAAKPATPAVARLAPTQAEACMQGQRGSIQVNQSFSTRSHGAEEQLKPACFDAGTTTGYGAEQQPTDCTCRCFVNTAQVGMCNLSQGKVTPALHTLRDNTS